MDASEASTGCIIAPGNFSQVESGVYRSACPGRETISFLKTLGLTTAVNLTSNCVPDEVKTFYETTGVKLLTFDLGRGNRKHNIYADVNASTNALEALLDLANHPVLVHCKKGKHRTGCVIGLLRKNRNWDLSNIFTEYCSFAPTDKNREEDERFVEAFHYTNGGIEFAPE